jgi:putative phosphoesterase
MRVGIVSDTHGDTAVFRKIAARAGKVEHWLHAGDNYKDAAYLSSLTGVPVTAVAGNCDYHYTEIPQDEFLEINGAKLWLTHGHWYNVKHTVDDLLRQGLHYEVDIIVFGHTHIPLSEHHDGILIFNPGSPSYPRSDDYPTFGVITILCKNDITTEIVKLK